jgi:hypothetical protein
MTVDDRLAQQTPPANNPRFSPREGADRSGRFNREPRQEDAMAKGQQRSNKEKKKPKQDKKKIVTATPATSIGQGGKPQGGGGKKGN